MASPQDIAAFRRKVLGYYRAHARAFPWRNTRNPYRILLSEIMLQQTQAERVRKYYSRFLKKFPTIPALARGSLKDVLSLWQGLGYNRRAKYLHDAAIAISKNNGQFPKDTAGLRLLPGVGPYTAAAVAVFAYGTSETLIETNIRTVYLHHFFPGRTSVSDTEIIPLITETIDRGDPRRWYYALMDYGAYLKSTLPNPSRRSAHHARHTPFKGSMRELRGAIVRALASVPRLSKRVLLLKLQPLEREPGEIEAALTVLSKEGLLRSGKESVALL